MQSVQPESVGLSTDRLARIQPVMQGYIDRQEFAGVVTAISRRGQVAHLAKVGWQEIENERPMAFDTIFRIPTAVREVYVAQEWGHFRAPVLLQWATRIQNGVGGTAVCPYDLQNLHFHH